MYDYSQQPTITLDLKKVNQFKAVEMVKSLAQTECLAITHQLWKNRTDNF